MGDSGRFAFGANWRRFLSTVGEPQILNAERSLQERLGTARLDNRTFLDVGSGSGLFSLAARRLGAKVVSFDYDAQSVACTQELKDRYFQDDPDWSVMAGSILDQQLVARLRPADVVYSWGVLHHTGQMHRALENVAGLVSQGGQLFIAIYNDQGWISRYWTSVKQIYNSGPIGRFVMIAWHFPYLYLARWAARALQRRLELERGMSLWYDMLDWLGGYPFEVATPDAIEMFYKQRGFVLMKAITCGNRMGCNEFVFTRGTGLDDLAKAASPV